MPDTARKPLSAAQLRQREDRNRGFVDSFDPARPTRLHCEWIAHYCEQFLVLQSEVRLRGEIREPNLTRRQFRRKQDAAWISNEFRQVRSELGALVNPYQRRLAVQMLGKIRKVDHLSKALLDGVAEVLYQTRTDEDWADILGASTDTAQALGEREVVSTPQQRMLAAGLDAKYALRAIAYLALFPNRMPSLATDVVLGPMPKRFGDIDEIPKMIKRRGLYTHAMGAYQQRRAQYPRQFTTREVKKPDLVKPVDEPVAVYAELPVAPVMQTERFKPPTQAELKGRIRQVPQYDPTGSVIEQRNARLLIELVETFMRFDRAIREQDGFVSAGALPNKRDQWQLEFRDYLSGEKYSDGMAQLQAGAKEPGHKFIDGLAQKIYDRRSEEQWQELGVGGYGERRRSDVVRREALYATNALLYLKDVAFVDTQSRGADPIIGKRPGVFAYSPTADLWRAANDALAGLLPLTLSSAETPTF